jgi:hypothetical protein
MPISAINAGIAAIQVVGMRGWKVLDSRVDPEIRFLGRGWMMWDFPSGLAIVTGCCINRWQDKNYVRCGRGAG